MTQLNLFTRPAWRKTDHDLMRYGMRKKLTISGLWLTSMATGEQSPIRVYSTRRRPDCVAVTLQSK